MDGKIPLKELAKVAVKLIEAYGKQAKTDILNVSEADFYWSIPLAEMLVENSVAPKPDVGSLKDDWEFIEPMIREDSYDVCIMMMHVYPIFAYITLKAIKDGIVPSK